VEGSRGINPLDRQLRTPLLVLMIPAGLVLQIACVNIAGLLLARGAARQRAVRMAPGARPGRVPRLVLGEIGTIGAIGITAAALLATAIPTWRAMRIEPAEALRTH
jgi:ABC-type lipoprotein release transport system permease subunit